MLAIGCVWLAATAAERLPIPPPGRDRDRGGVGRHAPAHSPRRTPPRSSPPSPFPPFTAGLRRGTRGALASLSAELGTLAFVAVVAYGAPQRGAGSPPLTWAILSLGLGLIGSFIHATYREPRTPSTPTAPLRR